MKRSLFLAALAACLLFCACKAPLPVSGGGDETEPPAETSAPAETAPAETAPADTPRPDGPVEFNAQYIRTNGYHEEEKYPRAVLICSLEELEAYIAENEGKYELGHRETVYADTTIGFADAVEAYGEEWFSEHQLLMVLVESGSGSTRYEVVSVSRGEKNTVAIKALVPEVGTCDMAEWHILIELPVGSFAPQDEFEISVTGEK